VQGNGELILAIETSCDETSASVVAGGRTILSNVISSQSDLHAEFGGVVPEIAARSHLEALTPVIATALVDADVTFWDIHAVAATLGPGLMSSLLVGVAEGKAIAAALGIPFLGVNHLEAHLYSNLLDQVGGSAPPGPDGRAEAGEPRTDGRAEAGRPRTDGRAKWPAVALLISGGHTLLIHVQGDGDYAILGGTIDDAAGEAFDKVARFLGLDYPGGPEIDRIALRGDPGAVRFPRPMLTEPGFDVSYSGLKTAVVNHVRREEAAGRAVSVADIAASFQQAVVEVQVAKAMAAVEHSGVDRVLLCGGVAANSGLRSGLGDACAAGGVELYIPPPELCTDNAAMVACCAHALLARGTTTPLDATPDPNLALVPPRA